MESEQEQQQQQLEEGTYTICWQAHGLFGRSGRLYDATTAARECTRLNREYPRMRHWTERMDTDEAMQPAVPDGPPPSFAARLYHAWAVNDLRMFEAVCADVPVSDMRLLAQRLMRMSTEVRMLIDARERKAE